MALWQVELLGGLRAIQAERVVTRFETGRVAALLACLALFPRAHPREELIERLWPESDPTAGRNRLRNTLSVLKSLLEPPGVPAGSVLVIDRFSVRIAPQSLETDAARWERLIRAGKYAEAEALWQGELLPGYYDDWVVEERERLNALRENLPTIATTAESEPSVVSETVLALPSYPTRFFGRIEERKLLTTLLDTERLITLTGPGGIGKTRLSVECAHGMTTRFPGGIAFVALAQRWSVDGLVEALPAALQLPSSRSPLAVLRKHTERHDTLLILDNFEQLVSNGGTELVEMLLTHAPGLTLLVTSRRVLGVAGERELLLEPLSVPEKVTSLENAAQIPGIAMFLDRAQASRPRFALRTDNLDSILSLCQRLEGMPLAIELAASRVRGYTLAQMDEAMADRFSLLTRPGGGARKEDRHASLRATIEWSWRLLSPESQRLFARMSVFRSGASADAVAAVCDEPEAQVLLEGLVADSLVVASAEDADEMRFSLLESLREFAAERLPLQERHVTELRHAHYFLTLASSVNSDDLHTLQPLEENLQNLLAALDTGWEHSRDSVFWAGLNGFLGMAFVRGHQRLAGFWAARAAEHWSTVESPLRFALLNITLGIYLDSGRIEEAHQLSEQMLTDAKAENLVGWQVHAELNLGYIANIRGELESALSIQQDALAKARTLNYRDPLVRSLSLAARASNSVAMSLLSEQPERATELFEEVDTLSQEALSLSTPHSSNYGFLHLLRSMVLLMQKKWSEAYAGLKITQRVCFQEKYLALLMFAFWHESFCQLGMPDGDYERATLCYGAFCMLREQMDYKTLETTEEQNLQDSLKTALGEQDYQSQLQQAQETPLKALVFNDSP
ncbi:MAG: hypothetical protein QM758_12075 [Armatimonas sp.]